MLMASRARVSTGHRYVQSTSPESSGIKGKPESGSPWRPLCLCVSAVSRSAVALKGRRLVRTAKVGKGLGELQGSIKRNAKARGFQIFPTRVSVVFLVSYLSVVPSWLPMNGLRW